jgi:hypothetical protein
MEKTDENAIWLADLANGETSGAELKNLLAVRLRASEVEIESATREIEISRRVRRVLEKLRQAEVEIPADFEVKIMDRIRKNVTLLDLLEVYMNGFGYALVEFVNVLFSFFPEKPQPQTT